MEEKPLVSNLETKRGRGRPRKPAHLKHPNSKDLDRCDENGRVLRKLRKRAYAGRIHHKTKEANRKRADKRNYAKRRESQAAWRKTMRRKWSVWVSRARRKAAKQGVAITITYPEFLLLWHGREHEMGNIGMGGAGLIRKDPAGPYSRGNLEVRIGWQST